MPLTKNFRDTVWERAQRDTQFRHALYREALHEIFNGDQAVGRSMLRNYINATIGFPMLSRKTRIPSPSLQRMFGPKGNPSATNLFGVLRILQKSEGVSVKLSIAS